MIATHNLLDSVRSSKPLWSILHAPGVILASPQHVVFVAYPLLPWVGVTAGYGFGQIYRWSADRRKVFLLRLGTALTAAFTVLRYINLCGDPDRWVKQKSAAFTLLSFLTPPSIRHRYCSLC